MKKYSVYGFTIESEIDLKTDLSSEQPDLWLRVVERLDTEIETTDEQWIAGNRNETRITVRGVGDFLVCNGQDIYVVIAENANVEMLRAYILSSCFAFLQQQRGVLPVHSCCVTKNGKTMLICGESGAGKSTIATVFLKNGWKLMSDDITPIFPENGKYYAQSSFPYRKMWEDAMERNDVKLPVTWEIYRRNGQTKYQLDASSQFVYDKKHLDYCVMLTAGSEQLYLKEVQGFAKVDLLMKNRFVQRFVLNNEIRQWQFSMCIGIASQIRAFLAERPYGEHTEQQIYEYIISEIEKDLEK